MGTSMLQRSQTTSSHIKVINKNSSSAELQSLCKLRHESAKKREEARGYSTAIGADGWPVDPRHPVYSRGPGGHEIFSEAAPQRDRGGAQILQHFRCVALFEPSQWVSGDLVGGASNQRVSARRLAVFGPLGEKLERRDLRFLETVAGSCWLPSMLEHAEASGFLHAARPRSADPWGMLETCSNIPMGIDTKYRWRAPEGRPAGRAGPRRPGRCTGSMA